MDPIAEFLKFLIQKDNEYADLFLPVSRETYSIKKCFMVYNNNLIYRRNAKLRQDIKNEVLEKYQGLLKEEAYYIEIDESELYFPLFISRD